MKEKSDLSYWKGSLQDVEEAVREVKKGRVYEMRASAGGRPIYRIEYGYSNLPPSKATLSSALGARDYSCYADKSGRDYNRTVFLAGCIHGGEFEGTVAILNLIHLIETGEDYAGDTDEELLSCIDHLHLILMPVCNPDGRSHVPFNNYVGKTFRELRYYNQGTWKDGSLCGWPQCKRFFPIKDYVDYLGGYYNDDGVNMMHDDFFGYASAETQNVLDVCRLYAPDASVLFHGGAESRNHITTQGYVSGHVRRRTCELIERTFQLYEKAGLAFIDNRKDQLSYEEEQEEPPVSFNLPSAMHHCCGDMCITFESNQGLSDLSDCSMDNEAIYLSHRLFLLALFQMVIEEYRETDSQEQSPCEGWQKSEKFEK